MNDSELRVNPQLVTIQIQTETHMITSKVETITPDIAKVYLSMMTEHQRKLRQSWVDALARSMKNGSFLTTHQGICFDEANLLIDGQHRLHAIIKYGGPIQIMVTRDVPVNAWHATDNGCRRTIADMTGINKALAEPLRLALNLSNIKQPDHADMLSAINSPLGVALTKLVNHAPTSKRIFSSSPIKLSAAIWMAETGLDYPCEQYRNLILQEYGLMSPTIQSFCKQMIRVDEGLRGSSKEGLLCRSFKAFDPSDRELTKIQMKNEADTLAIIRTKIRHLINPAK